MTTSPRVPTALPSLGGLKHAHCELYAELLDVLESSKEARMKLCIYFASFVRWATPFEIVAAVQLEAGDFYELLETVVPRRANHVAHLMMALGQVPAARSVLARISRDTGVPILSPLPSPSMHDKRVIFPSGYLEENP